LYLYSSLILYINKSSLSCNVSKNSLTSCKLFNSKFDKSSKNDSKSYDSSIKTSLFFSGIIDYSLLTGVLFFSSRLYKLLKIFVWTLPFTLFISSISLPYNSKPYFMSEHSFSLNTLSILLNNTFLNSFYCSSVLINPYLSPIPLITS